ncbi:hypothetical protein NMY22_g10466 [Coprinellus aureogranulatus]|nr:hypothetical protein NMY22_g10466 [Coprinellus aureogranulatus]
MLYPFVMRGRFATPTSPRLWAAFPIKYKPHSVRRVNTVALQDIGVNVPERHGTFRWKASPTVRLSTLDPSRLTRSDIIDMSGKLGCYLVPKGTPRNTEQLTVRYKALAPKKVQIPRIQIPFPPGTTGVFYFNDRRRFHPVAGDIRFRVLPVNTDQVSVNNVDFSAQFAQGHDLLGHDGLFPWRISLLSIMYARRPIYGFMKKQGYITEEAEEEVKKLRQSPAFKKLLASQGLPRQTVEIFTDPFIIDLSAVGLDIVFFTKEGIIPVQLRPRQLTAVQGGLRGTPYSGIVLVRFEMIEHRGKKRVVLRVLKFLKPPDPNDSVVQEEGSLLKKFHRAKNVETVWMAGTQTRFITPSSLKLLEETYLHNSNT